MKELLVNLLNLKFAYELNIINLGEYTALSDMLIDEFFNQQEQSCTPSH